MCDHVVSVVAASAVTFIPEDNVVGYDVSDVGSWDNTYIMVIKTEPIILFTIANSNFSKTGLKCSLRNGFQELNLFRLELIIPQLHLNVSTALIKATLNYLGNLCHWQIDNK